MNRSLACLALGAALLVGACRRAEVSGPPDIRAGRDECIECGMLAAEDRCSCAMLLDLPEGRGHLVFDDLGCLLDYRAANPDRVPIEMFVRDYPSGRWVNAYAATYLAASPDRIATPMASGLVAFESADAASAQQARSGGEIATLRRLAEIRAQWKAARYGSPRPDQP